MTETQETDRVLTVPQIEEFLAQAHTDRAAVVSSLHALREQAGALAQEAVRIEERIRIYERLRSDLLRAAADGSDGPGAAAA